MPSRTTGLPVLSVSRRTDMVRWYPGDLVRTLEARYPPDKVHSIVVVTKFPEAMLKEPLISVLGRYDLVTAQVTITGLGGTRFEPRVPPAEKTLRSLPRLIDLLGSPERVFVRIDPILHWREEDDGPVRSNLGFFREIAEEARRSGVGLVKTSLASAYSKVVRRFRERGLEFVDPAGEQRERAVATLEKEAAAAGLSLEFCCEGTRPPRACVDGRLLTRLHPLGLVASREQAAGQRAHCGCTRSIDLAWYSSHPCPSGCLYCYANPLFPDARPRPGPGGKAADK